MRIRPISIAGMRKAVCVTAVLVFLAGWTVPAQAVDYIYLKNGQSGDYNFCTHEKTTGNAQIEKKQIKSEKCNSLKCGADCYVKRCAKLGAIAASAKDYVRYRPYTGLKVSDRKLSGCPSFP